MVEEEEDVECGTERESDANPVRVELPEANEPRAAASRLEGMADWEGVRIGGVQASPVCDARGCDECDGHPVVGEQAADVPVECVGAGERLECRSRAKHQEREDDGHERARVLLGCGHGRMRKLPSEDLYAVLEVDPGHVETEGVAWEESHVAEEVTP
jgi:hypothetical protein